MEVLSHNILLFRLLFFGFLFSYASLGNERCSASLATRKHPYHYVHETFRKNNYTITKKFFSHDPSFVPIKYKARQNMIWNQQSVCQKDTFILLVYFLYKNDVGRRNVIRQYVKQGMMVDGQKINYVFVVASPRRDKPTMKLLRRENKRFKDILVSVHEDSYSNMTLTALDAFMWVRDYCKQAQYIGRVDGDVWIQLGNLIHYLKTVPKKGYYGGSLALGRMDEEGMVYKDLKIIPKDYPKRRWLFNFGGANLYSNDVVPFINIGTMYMDLIIPVSEDVLIGEILRRAGIDPYPAPHDYVLYVNHYSMLEGGVIPKNAIFIHGIKNMTVFRRVYRRHASTYLVPFAKSLVS